jgi:hypothetical protein
MAAEVVVVAVLPKGKAVAMDCRWLVQEARFLQRQCKGVIPGKYWHKETTNSLARPKAARYEQPIFTIKPVDESLIQRTSFQSTSSCNLSSVNASNELSMYVGCKQRGRGMKKQQRGIEMNESCALTSTHTASLTKSIITAKTATCPTGESTVAIQCIDCLTFNTLINFYRLLTTIT